jgi:hypothetical protein
VGGWTKIPAGLREGTVDVLSGMWIAKKNNIPIGEGAGVFSRSDLGAYARPYNPKNAKFVKQWCRNVGDKKRRT